jgi:predicted ABC-type ATPase
VAFALKQITNKALASRSNFAFETNYSSDMASEISQHFREAGYKTTLVYFGLDNIEISTSRVQERYELGGHDVSAATIKFNFEEGIKRVNKDLHLFDEAFFVDTNRQNVRIVAFVKKPGKQYHRIVEKVDWYKANFENTVNNLDFTSKQVKRLKIRHHLH